ncbi:MAG TPA: hypothetical protein VJ814_08875 [Gaiellaceae bacterium]|nr:hypothetical protein [Gaiellaceae bacterium]
MRKLLNATRTTKMVVAAVAAVTVFASVYGFAATLGVSTGGLGADTKVVASCGTGMTFAYTTTYYTGVPGYAVNGINLTNIPAGCLSKNLSVTFYGSGNAAVGSAVTSTLPASGTTQSISITPSANTIDASAVTGVAVVVS